MLELELRGKCDQYSNLLRCFISIKPLVLLQHYQYHMYIVNFVYKYNITLCASVSCLQQFHQTPIFTVVNILL